MAIYPKILLRNIFVPGGGNGNPPLYSCLENPRDRGICGGYSPWGWKESDMIE